MVQRDQVVSQEIQVNQDYQELQEYQVQVVQQDQMEMQVTVEHQVQVVMNFGLLPLILMFFLNPLVILVEHII